jgi:opacity protein-like surface antigen
LNTSQRFSSATLGLALALFAVLVLPPQQVAAQGLTYSLVPSARWIDWDDDLNFERTRLLGGGVNIGFGRFIGLTAFYHENDDASLFATSDSTDFDTELVQAGGEVTVALGTGTLVPVLKGGASILRFRPADDAVSEFSKLSFDYGAGLRAIFSETITGEVMVESSEYRLATERLTGGTVPDDESIRQNLSLRAGIGIQLGSRTFDRASETDEALDSPFDNFALAVEPSWSRFTFDDALGIEDQDAWGARAGFDFGSFFGLRAFYWRGTEEDDLGDFNEFRAWGGEAQFNLGAGPGINPYLVGGVTHFDWDADVPGAALIHDRNAVTLGAGVDIDVSDRLRLSVAARDQILAGSDIGGDLIEEVSDPDDLIHNWQFSAGIGFVLGEGSSRGERSTPRAGVPAMPQEPATPRRVVGDTAPEPQPQQAAAGAEVTAETRQEITSDTIEVRMPGSGESRMIVLPVLEEGEIYVRFGGSGTSPFVSARPEAEPAAGMTNEELRTIIREEVAAMQAGGATSTELMQELRALELRLQTRLDAMGAAGQQPAAGVPQQTVVVEEADQPGVSRESRELRPYGGISFGGDTQLAMGVMADLGPMTVGSAFHIVPQVALGFGEGRPSYLANVSLEYRFLEFGVGEQIRLTPIVSTGPSIVKQDGTDLRLTTFLGTGVRLLGDGQDERLNLFTGFQGVDFFGDARWLVGLRLLR